MRKPASWLRHLVHAWLPAAGQRPSQGGRRSNRFGRAAALAPARDQYMEPRITGLISELITRGNQLRRQLNVGKRADQRAWKAETIDWLRRAESLSRDQRPTASGKIIPDLDTDISLYRMLISHQLSDLEHIKENRPATQR